MSSEIKANKISPATGTAFTLGDSGDTFTIPSGVTLTNSGTATGFGTTSAVQATMSANQSFTKNVWAKINFDTENFDINNEFDTSNNRFTADEAGYYLVAMTVVKDNAETQFNNIYSAIYKNGSVFFSTKVYGDYPYYTIESSLIPVTTIVYLNGSSDYIEGYFMWGANGTLGISNIADANGHTYTQLNITKVA